MRLVDSHFALTMYTKFNTRANVRKFYYRKWQPECLWKWQNGKWFSRRMTSIEMDYIALACVIFFFLVFVVLDFELLTMD